MTVTTQNPSPETNNNGQRFDLYQQVTDTIIQQLEKGTIPWQQPWKGDNQMSLRIPRNAVTGNFYRGVNIVLLWSYALDKKYMSNEWASLKQWNTKKEAIRKDETGKMIVFTDVVEKEVDGELTKIPFLKYSKVFNRCQLQSFDPSIVSTPNDAGNNVEKIATVEDFVANTLAQIDHREGAVACYMPAVDKIDMPPPSSFIDTVHCNATENYYATLMHELTHWTGHNSRLDRKIKNRFGDHAYAEEELIAELGAAFLTSEFEIASPAKTNHAGYIGSWLKVLKDNKQFIISAASEASKAVSYMKDLQPLKLS